MRNVLLVIRHEIVTMLSKPSFWIMTFLFPAMIVALNIFSQRAALDSFQSFDVSRFFSSASAIGYVDEAGVVKTIPERTAEGVAIPARSVRRFPDTASAQTALEAGEVSQYFIVPSDFVHTGNLVMVDSKFSLFSSLDRSNLFEYIVNFNLAGSAPLAAALVNPTSSVEDHRLAPGQPRNDASNPAVILVPFVFFFVITMSSGFMLQSVSKEKENRTVEVLLLSLRPRDLMLGKVVGLGLVALLQMAVWLGVSYLALGQGGGLFGGSGGSSFNLRPEFIVWALLYFVLGYLLYGSALGALGALAPTAREGTQFTFVMILPLLLPIWFSGVIISSPNGDLATILSLFPLTAPTTMITRMTITSVPVWQLGLGLIGLAITAYLLVLLSARFFRADTLLSIESLNLRRILGQLRG
ncbi:MAG TPA: ABC transporter permease [Anaerolineae bacterium]